MGGPLTIMLAALGIAATVRIAAKGMRTAEEGKPWKEPPISTMSNVDAYEEAKEVFFMASLEKLAKQRHPDLARIAPLGRAVARHELDAVLVEIHLKNGEVITERYFNNEIWKEGSALPGPKAVPTGEEELEEKDFVLEWLSKNLPGIQLEIDVAEQNGTEEISRWIPDKISGNEDALARITEEISEEFGWLASIRKFDDWAKIVLSKPELNEEEVDEFFSEDVSENDFAYAESYASFNDNDYPYDAIFEAQREDTEESLAA